MVTHRINFGAEITFYFSCCLNGIVINGRAFDHDLHENSFNTAWPLLTRLHLYPPFLKKNYRP